MPGCEELAFHRELDVRRARHLAHHDETHRPALIEILLLDRLDQALDAGETATESNLALLFLDLDRFKEVNDRLGHVAGDKLLKRVAERLQSSIRGGDTACRYGGDEFVILLTEIDDERHAREVAEKLRARLVRP